MALEMGILNVADLLDAYWVSRLGSAALAAAALSLAVRWLVNSISVGLGTSALAVVARRVGARDQEAADHATGQAILLGVIVSALLAVLGMAIARPLLQLMGADAEVLPLGLTYLHTLFLGSFAWVLVQVINPMIRGAGDAWPAMGVLFLTTAVIVVSEPILVLGLGPLPKLGIAGSAGAYVLGFGCGLVLQAAILWRGRARIRLRWRHLRPDLPLMVRIARIALPSALQMALRAAATMVILVMVGAYGTFATAGYGLADRFQLIILVPCFGLGNTAGTLVGQNLGAGKPGRAGRCAWWVGAYAVGYLLPLATLLFVFARPLITTFDPTPQVVEIGVECIRIIIFAIVLDGLGFVLARGLDGAGDTVPAASINLLTLWALQLPAAFLLSRWLSLGLKGIWWGRALSYVANGLFFVAWFWRGKWREREV
jgi:putative MATE family efflux protein